MIFYTVIRAVLFGGALTTLILECWHFQMDSEMHEISHRSLFVIELITLSFLGLALLTARNGWLFPTLLFVPIPLVLWEYIKKADKKQDSRATAQMEESEVHRLTEVIEKTAEPALLYKPLIELGDLYSRRQEYSKAIGLYRRAEEIGEKNNLGGLPGISFKINQAEKEKRIKEREIWVCTACGYDNPGSITACKMCGGMKDMRKSAKRDILVQKQEIKTDTINIVFVALIVIAGLHLLHFLLRLMAFLYGRMPWWAAIPLVIAVSALSIFFFLKLIAFVKNEVIPKLLK